jgi:hypothetical protein
MKPAFITPLASNAKILFYFLKPPRHVIIPRKKIFNNRQFRCFVTGFYKIYRQVKFGTAKKEGNYGDKRPGKKGI